MSIRFREILSIAAVLATQLAGASEKPVYSLSSPGATPLYVPMRGEALDPQCAAWAAANAFVAPASSLYNRDAVQDTAESERESDPAAPVRLLASVAAGFPAERNKPLYYLGDKLLAPDGVDWDATYQVFTETEGIQENFLFDTKNKAV